MRLRNITGSREVIAESPYVVPEDTLESCPGTWHEIFGNDHPIHIEIGMGKGRFLHTLAKSNPQINYVGIEKYSSVLLRAIQKMEEDELPNLKFIRMDAEDIDKVFGKEEVDRIYLNFSDPWPKDRHAKRRLPSRQFLARYDVILKKEGTLEFKTDNRPLFDFRSRGTGTRRMAGAGDHLRSAQRSCTDGKQCHDGIRGEILFHRQPYLQIYYFR